MARVTRVDVTPLSISLHEPFGIATGTQPSAENALVRLELDDGSCGLGEAAPFPAVNGETQAVALKALTELRQHLVGFDANRWRELGPLLAPYRTTSPTACCAVESALLDAWARCHSLSLWHFFGGATAVLVSDITIPTGDLEHAAASASRAAQLGYRQLKIKVGQGALPLDIERVRAVVTAAPNCKLLLDGNAALSASNAIQLCQALVKLGAPLEAFEQPTPKADFEGLRAVAEATGLAVLADESAQTPTDVLRIAQLNRSLGSAVGVNIKITKSGLLPALEMIAIARTAGLKLMIGGMVESELCMSLSACIAAGIGGFDYVDLDTPLFMADSPFVGGFARNANGRGPHLDVSVISSGHGVVKPA